jgi:tetratricopeptide (TPR) repeat protein
MGNHAEAVQAAKRFMELKPGEANAYDTLALALDFSGASDRALEALEQALRLNPTFGIARVHRQAMLARGGRLREAIEDTTRPDVLVSEGVSVQRYRSQAAYALWKVGREHESRALIGTIDPALNAWGPYLLLDVKAAAAMRRSAIAGRSGRWGLRQQFYYLAEEARVQNQPERRLTHLREALRYRPSWGGMETLEDALGDAYLDAGRWDEAISEYQRALSRFPGTPLTLYHLAQARARKRENVAAARQYRLFLQAWASADEDLLQIAEARQGAGAAGRSNADVRSTAAVRRAAGPKREVPGPVNPLLTEPHFWSESTVPRLMN